MWALSMLDSRTMIALQLGDRKLSSLTDEVWIARWKRRKSRRRMSREEGGREVMRCRIRRRAMLNELQIVDKPVHRRRRL